MSNSMQWRVPIQHALQLRNARTRHIASLLEEANRLKSELVAATVAKKALERQAVVTVLASGHGDISGLLSDTPLPPHLCAQLAVEVQSLLTKAANCDESCDTQETEAIMMRDPVFRTCTERVISRLLIDFGTDGRDGAPNTGELGLDLRVATLENEFAALACAALLSTRGVGGGDFDLPRLLRMLATFRTVVADACYGSMARPTAGGAAAQTASEETPAMMDPMETVAARKARLAVTHEVCVPSLFTSAFLLACTSKPSHIHVRSGPAPHPATCFLAAMLNRRARPGGAREKVGGWVRGSARETKRQRQRQRQRGYHTHTHT